METARDLACADLWQASLERSLARRGRSTRGSLELFHLRPERDLSRVDLLRESAVYSQMRRSADDQTPVDGASGRRRDLGACAAGRDHPPRPAGRPGRRRPHRADDLPSRRARLQAGQGAGNRHRRSAEPRRRDGRVGSRDHDAHAAVARAASVPPYVAIPRTLSPRPRRHGPHATTHAHIAAARDASGGAAGVASHAASGGAAPAGAAQRVGGDDRARGPHAHDTGGVHTHTTPAVHTKPASTEPRPCTLPRSRSTRSRSSTTRRRFTPRRPRRRPTSAPAAGAVEEQTTVAHPRPVAVAHPRPVAKPHPVATTPPPAKPAPAPAPPVAAGQYVNPLADAQVTPERIDQGVDYAGSGPLRALGDGKVTYVGTSGTGWPGAFIEYQLTDGSAGRPVCLLRRGDQPGAGAARRPDHPGRAADRPDHRRRLERDRDRLGRGHRHRVVRHAAWPVARRR